MSCFHGVPKCLFGRCLVLLAEVKQDTVNQSSSRDYPTTENKWLFWNHHCWTKKELGIVKTLAASFCTFHHLARKGVVSTPISIHILIYDRPSLDYLAFLHHPRSISVHFLVLQWLDPRVFQGKINQLQPESEDLQNLWELLVLPWCTSTKPKSKWSHLWWIKSRRIVLAFGKAQSGNAMEWRKAHQHEPL